MKPAAAVGAKGLSALSVMMHRGGGAEVFDEDEWDRRNAQQAAQEREVEAQERYAIAQLLRARQLDAVAAVVAASGYRTEQVDNFNGGQYESVFEVRPDAYDFATGDQPRSALTDAATAAVGAEHFVGISIRVRRTPAPPGWDQQMLQDIVERHRSARDQPQEPAPTETMLAVVAVQIAEPVTEHDPDDAAIDNERPF